MLKSNLFFLLPYFIYLLLGGFVLAFFNKEVIHIIINSYHTPILDSFFYYFTHLGDGLMAIFISAILILVKYRYAIIVFISYSISGLFTQLLKRTLFSDALRPKLYFEGSNDIYFLPDMKNALYHSFPSGHATTAFALYLSLSLFVSNGMLKLLFFVTALLVAFSRVYLSQHFFGDVYFASIIGTVFSLIVYNFFSYPKYPILEKSLYASFFTK